MVRVGQSCIIRDVLIWLNSVSIHLLITLSVFSRIYDLPRATVLSKWVSRRMKHRRNSKADS